MGVLFAAPCSSGNAYCIAWLGEDGSIAVCPNLCSLCGPCDWTMPACTCSIICHLSGCFPHCSLPKCPACFIIEDLAAAVHAYIVARAEPILTPLSVLAQWPSFFLAKEQVLVSGSEMLSYFREIAKKAVYCGRTPKYCARAAARQLVVSVAASSSLSIFDDTSLFTTIAASSCSPTGGTPSALSAAVSIPVMQYDLSFRAFRFECGSSDPPGAVIAKSST